jgi:hypothetical protein
MELCSAGISAVDMVKFEGVHTQRRGNKYNAERHSAPWHFHLLIYSNRSGRHRTASPWCVKGSRPIMANVLRRSAAGQSGQDPPDRIGRPLHTVTRAPTATLSPATTRMLSIHAKTDGAGEQAADFAAKAVERLSLRPVAAIRGK